MLRFIKTYAIFISMIIGVITFPVLSILAPYTKYFLFTMLFITYCKVSLKHLKFRPLHLRLSILQLLLSIALYIIIYPLNKDLAIGSLICVIVPTATSAPVVTGLLGGSIEFVTTYSIISSVGAALIVPFIFPLIGGHGINNEDISFLYCSWIIGYKVIPLLICPLILAIIVKNALPYIHKKIEDRLSISFWLWVTALSILMAKTANDIFYMDKEDYNIAAIIAIVTAVVCAIQFWFGRLMGKKYNNVVSGGQSLGQKNTILAIWMAQTFFNPIVAIAPASYVLWQNLINSYQLWRFRKNELK